MGESGMTKPKTPTDMHEVSDQAGIKPTNQGIRSLAALVLAVGICGTGSVQAEALKGGICVTHQSRITGAEHVWICEHLGRVTIRQIYEKGFRVVSAYSLDPAEKTSQFQYLIIEEQGK
jgi:hypothetical protein